MAKPSNVIHANDFAPAAFSIILLKTAATIGLSCCISNEERRPRSFLRGVKRLQAHKYSFESVSLIFQGHASF